jgi:alpha-galactosidase/6-phospho-beta-glucosidase family protein
VNLSLRTKVTVSLAGVLTLALLGWNARAYFDDFRHEQKDAFRELSQSIQKTSTELNGRIDTNASAISLIAKDRVTTPELRLWAYQLERENRAVQRNDGKTGLVVPEPARAQE